MKKILFLITSSFLFVSCNATTNNDKQSAMQDKHLSLIYHNPTSNWISSSILVKDGSIYFGTFDNTFVKASVKTGKKVWEFKTKGECYFKPIITKEGIFFSSFDLYLYHLNHKGKIIWKYKTEDRIKSAPTALGNQIFFSVKNSGVYAIDIKTSKLNWKMDQAPILGSTTELLVKNNLLFVGDLNQSLQAINPLSGITMWSNKYDGYFLSNLFATDQSLIFASFNYSDFKKSFLASVDISSGRENWRKNSEFNARNTPTISNELIYYSTEGDSSIVVCLSLKDGLEKWHYFIPQDGLETNILFHKNKIYFGTYNRLFYCLNADNGEILFKEQLEYGIGNIFEENGNVYLSDGGGSIYMVTK